MARPGTRMSPAKVVVPVPVKVRGVPAGVARLVKVSVVMVPEVKLKEEAEIDSRFEAEPPVILGFVSSVPLRVSILLVWETVL